MDLKRQLAHHGQSHWPVRLALKDKTDLDYSNKITSDYFCLAIIRRIWSIFGNN